MIEYPQRKQKPDHTHIFIGVNHIIKEKLMKDKIKNIIDIDKLKLVNIVLESINTHQ